MKHTPGEWTIKISADGEKFSVISDNGEWPFICLICGFDEPAKANAQLIAAAPEMLEIIKNLPEVTTGMFVDLNDYGKFSKAYGDIFNLINKIEGEDGS